MAEEAKKVHVIVAVFEHLIDEVRVAGTNKKATEIEREFCENYDVPFGPKRRKKYYNDGGENEVHHLIMEIER